MAIYSKSVNSLARLYRRLNGVARGMQIRHTHTAGMVLGIEERSQGERYHWHGSRRGSSASSPVALFQWTLQGEGIFRFKDTTTLQAPGMAFLAGIPSDHEYSLSAGSKSWRFLWMMIQAPFIQKRICEAAGLVGHTFPLDEEDRLAVSTLQLFEAGYSPFPVESFDLEKRALDWMIEIERHIHHLRFEPDPKKEWMERARNFYLANRSRPFGVNEFAAHLDMSRSHLGHVFKAATGIAPSEWFRRLRMDGAIDLLARGAKLEAIAADCGFHDANHFCKCFRAQFQTSPSRYRKWLGIKRFPPASSQSVSSAS